jgi:hypothetical protein
MALAKTLFLFGLAGVQAFAAMLPEKWMDATRGPVEKVTPADLRIWNEYGFAEAEKAAYKPDSKGEPFTATSYRFQDSTGAMAALQWRAVAGSTFPSPGKWIARLPDGDVIRAEGNYLIVVRGRNPGDAEIAALIASLPRYEQSSLPVLPDYLPEENLVAGSRRYVIGPEALAAFEPRVSPSVAAFHLGVEAQFADYQTPDGLVKMGIFSYPTPAIARERLQEIQKLAGTVAKRTGSLVVATFGASNADAAERLLAKVRFQGSISWSEYVPTQRDNIGNLIINIFVLIGILLGFSLVAGLAFGGVRSLLRFGRAEEPDAMITLHLSDR